MTLIKTSLLNGIAVAVKVGSALVLNKILAVYVGPAGYAVIGQFQNAISILVGLVGGLITTGVTKTTAQHYDDETKQHKVWKTAIRFSLLSSFLVGFVLLFVGRWLSEWLLQRADMSSLFVCLALALPAITVNNLLLAIVNGKKEVGIYATANITGSIVAMIVTGLLASNFGLFGALLALTINPAIVLLATTTLVTRLDWFKSNFFWGAIDKPAAREISAFAMMGITSIIIVPTTYMLIRDHLATHLGLPAAGYWQSSWKISEVYLMLVTSTLSVYYLPRLAEIRTAPDMEAEIIKVARFIMPIVIIGALTIYLLRDFIIRTLFTEDFLPMRELFLWQLLGDVIKIFSWVFGYIITARGLVKYFMFSEVYTHGVFLLMTWIFVDYLGLQGVAVAYSVTSSSHLILMATLARREMLRMPKK